MALSTHELGAINRDALNCQIAAYLVWIGLLIVSCSLQRVWPVKQSET